MQDPILDDADSRLMLFPIRYPTLWGYFKKSVSSFWPVESIDLSSDLKDWELLTSDERDFFSKILAFFASSDALVNENLCSRFANDVKAPEARNFYYMQMATESIHTEMYSLLLDTLVRDPPRKMHLLNGAREMPTVRSKAEFCQKWTSSARPFAERLVAFACTEGILFSGSFAAIFWLRTRGLCPGFCESNEYISRDEGLHRDFAIELHALLKSKCPEATAHTIVREAVSLEHSFLEDALPRGIRGLNLNDMQRYIEFVADHLLRSMGYPQLYNNANPLTFMENNSMQAKTNFFEKRPSDYSLAAARHQSDEVFNIDESF
jgi:ribonucleoside-diphosphate reductase subunit M2